MMGFQAILVIGKRSLGLALLWLLTASHLRGETLRFVQYNIKELSSEKIRGWHDSPQLQAVRRVVKRLDADFLAVNELQYDRPNVPDTSLSTLGSNLRLLAGILSYPTEPAHWLFSEANTGRNARRLPGGQYLADLSDRDLVAQVEDKVNFGIFPGQYSTGAISRLPLERVKVVADALLKDVFPGFDFSPYRDNAGGEINPDVFELFDKSFTILAVPLGNRRLNVILLHAVPAFPFGNPWSINAARNRCQLAFLEWFLTGKEEEGLDGVRAARFIDRLPAAEPFLAMGDFNTDLRGTDDGGSQSLLRLQGHFAVLPEANLDTYESASGFLSSRLDYIIAGNGVRVLESGVYRPSGKATSQEVREASDHFPVWAEISLP